MKYKDGTEVKLNDWVVGLTIENERIGGQVSSVDDAKKTIRVLPTFRINPAIVPEGKFYNFDTIMRVGQGIGTPKAETELTPVTKK